MKHRDIVTELRLKTAPELVNLLKDEREKLLKQRFDVAFRKLKSTSGLKASRKSIARIQTILREKLTANLADTDTGKEQ